MCGNKYTKNLPLCHPNGLGNGDKQRLIDTGANLGYSSAYSKLAYHPMSGMGKKNESKGVLS
jgi:hypothetical protein